jgi:hypothetical protein
VDRRIIKMDLKEIGLEGVDWIHLIFEFVYHRRNDDIFTVLISQDRDQWRALVNTIMNLQVP